MRIALFNNGAALRLDGFCIVDFIFLYYGPDDAPFEMYYLSVKAIKRNFYEILSAFPCGGSRPCLGGLF